MKLVKTHSQCTGIVLYFWVFRRPGRRDERVHPLYLSKDGLLSVEVIERRYLKVPLGQSKGDLVQNVLSGSCLSNEPPKTLLTWREVVKHCETAAKCRCASASWKRLWDKSIIEGQLPVLPQRRQEGPAAAVRATRATTRTASSR